MTDLQRFEEQAAQDLADSTICGGADGALVYIQTLVSQMRCAYGNAHGIAATDDIELQAMASEAVRRVTKRAAEIVNQHRARPL